MTKIIITIVLAFSVHFFIYAEDNWQSCAKVGSVSGGDLDFGWTSINSEQMYGLTLKNQGVFKGKIILYSKCYKIKKIKLISNTSNNSSGGNGYIAKYLSSDKGTIDATFEQTDRYGVGTLVWSSSSEYGDDYVCFYINKDNEIAYFNELYIEYTDVLIEKKKVVKGDLNGNGIVDIDDVNYIIDIILNN